MATITRVNLKTEVRNALGDRGLTHDGGGDGPLADYLPLIAGGEYEVPTLTRLERIAEYSISDTLTRVPNIYVCDEFAFQGIADARRYLIETHGASTPAYQWLGVEHPYAIGVVWSSHAQCWAWTTEGFMFWEPQADWIMEPQPYEIRPGHWGIWNMFC